MSGGLILPTFVFRAIDSNGAPLNGAQLQFYVTTTTTPTPAYTDASLGTPLSNPVVSDSAGFFPPIFLDPTVTYRMQLWAPGATIGMGSPIGDYDPISIAPGEASGAQVNAGMASGLYVSPATLAAWTGVATALGYTPLNKAGDTATNLLLTASSLTVNSAGYLGAPLNEEDSNYTFALSDAGSLVRANSGSGITYTIPPNSSVAFPVGTAILARNWGAGTVTLTRGAGVSQYLAGGGTSKEVALAQYGLATLIQEQANVWVTSGTGVS